LRALLALIALAVAAPVAAQNVVVSPVAETISMTVYRDPYRGENPINRNWPGGYALITETRTISIPAGESVIRFEGVSEGLFPETAIVTGLPHGVREKNRDARLLSPAGLVDAYLKRQVTLTRTDRATGKVREQSALVTSGPDGGVILETDGGVEALRCTGLPERMRYGGLPKDLSAKPTLSVITNSNRALKATVTLSYMAGGFDWQANYVLNAGKFADDHKIDLDVFGWLTIANGGAQSFPNANLMAVAGRPNRVGNAALPKAPLPQLVLKCWPAQRTHEVPFTLPYTEYADEDFAYEEEIQVESARLYALPMAAPPPPPAPVAAVVAEQEDLGDLKLYRVPERVDVNAKGQKQVAMIVQPKAGFRRVYKGQPVYNGWHQPMVNLNPTLVGENKKDTGLGLPLPSGKGMVFENAAMGNQLVGEITVKDRAIGDDIDWYLPTTPAVRLSTTLATQTKKSRTYRLVLSNSNPYAVTAEIKFPDTLRNLPEGMRRDDGIPTWFVTVPANDSSEIIVEVPLQ
jgi:hypothetical protein